MSHIGENLASKGFVVVSIDHKDSTYDDQKAFGSTLYNRPFDQLFVLNAIDRLNRLGSGSFLTAMVDTSRTGIIGYSMGGYGLVNVIGGGYSAASATFQNAPPNKLLAERGAASAAYQKSRDPRIKAAIAIGPWGMQGGFWDAEGLAGIRTPVMFVAGSVDDVSGYEKGTRAIYQAAVNADRYLLTFINANHNAAAPYPAPAESYTAEPQRSFFPLRRRGVGHRAHEQHLPPLRDRVFRRVSERRVRQAGLPGRRAERKRCGVCDGSRRQTLATHTYWKGFKRGTAVGLVLEHAKPTSDVHWTLRPGVRRQTARARGVARHVVPRVPVRRFAVADVPDIRPRACRDRSRQHRSHAAQFRELPLLPQPGDAAGVVGAVGAAVSGAARRPTPRGHHRRRAGVQSLPPRPDHPSSGHADHDRRSPSASG